MIAVDGDYVPLYNDDDDDDDNDDDNNDDDDDNNDDDNNGDSDTLPPQPRSPSPPPPPPMLSARALSASLPESTQHSIVNDDSQVILDCCFFVRRVSNVYLIYMDLELTFN